MDDPTRRHSEVPDFPRIAAAFHADGSVDVSVLGTARTFGPAPDADGVEPQAQALRHVRAVAASSDLGHPVRVHASTPEGEDSCLIVTPEGLFWSEEDPESVQEIDRLTTQPPADGGVPGPADGTAETGRATGPATERPGADRAPVARRARPAVPQRRTTDASGAGGVPVPPVVPRPDVTGASAAGRHSFLQTEIAVAPARQGARGLLNRLGLRLPPGPAEEAWRADVDAVCEHWPGPRTIAVANPKGSASKTPTTALLAAVLARHGGAGVLAWDNNETRGSLAWRTQRARHVATVLDLLPRVQQLLAPSAQAAELSHFTHHQPADKYDVLQSDQSVEGDHEVSAQDVEDVHEVVTRYYRLVVMDSGNSERAANWRAMVQRADVLVVPCTNSTDTPEAGRLMLESLATRDEHSRALARHAIAIVSQRDQTKGARVAMEQIVAGMRELVAEVVVIPFDPAMKEGVLHFDALRPATQRAWLRAAAAVARRL